MILPTIGGSRPTFFSPIRFFPIRLSPIRLSGRALRDRGATSLIGAVLVLWLIGAAPAPAAPPVSDDCSGPCPALFGTDEIIGHNLTPFHEWTRVMARSQAELAAAR